MLHSDFNAVKNTLQVILYLNFLDNTKIESKFASVLKYHAMQVYNNTEDFLIFLISTTSQMEVIRKFRASATLTEERIPSDSWAGILVGLKFVMDRVAKTKLYAPSGNRTIVAQLLSRHLTD
jgi:hypothetical protein